MPQGSSDPLKSCMSRLGRLLRRIDVNVCHVSSIKLAILDLSSSQVGRVRISLSSRRFGGSFGSLAM
jgi:hypothetical protein